MGNLAPGCARGDFHIVLGCTGSPPEIIESHWNLNIVNDLSQNLVSERLSLFLHIRDDDGEDDIEGIYILNDGDELFWSLTPSTWERYEQNNEIWIGSNDIRMYRDGAFPRGTYRLQVADRAGERDTLNVYLSSREVDKEMVVFPELRNENDFLEIVSGYTRHTLWFYDAGGSVVKIHATSNSRVDVTSLISEKDRSRITRVMIYAFDDKYGVGVVSGPFEL